MTVGELWDKLPQYPDDVEVYVGYVEGHSVMHQWFEVVETTALDGKVTISLMVDDIAIIQN